MIVFTEKEKDCIANHKYKGYDHGLTTKYIYDPVATRLLSITPLWLAPNIITLLDFFSILVSHIIIAYYSWNFDQPLPLWACLVSAFCYFSYIILDTMDGKQARKTLNGSPLGMMFDHGCDALGSPLSLCNMLAMMKCRSPLIVIIQMALGLGGFYMATYETYYMGGLFLEAINSVSEGSMVIMIVYVFTGFIGNEFWSSTIMNVGGVSISPMLMLLILIGVGNGIVMNIGTVVNIIKNSEAKPSLERVMMEFNSMWAVLMSAFAAYMFTPLWDDYPRLMVYFYGILFTYINVYTLAMQVVKTPLKCYIPSIQIPCLLFSIGCALFYLRYAK